MNAPVSDAGLCEGTRECASLRASTPMPPRSEAARSEAARSEAAVTQSEKVTW